MIQSGSYHNKPNQDLYFFFFSPDGSVRPSAVTEQCHFSAMRFYWVPQLFPLLQTPSNPTPLNLLHLVKLLQLLQSSHKHQMVLR